MPALIYCMNNIVLLRVILLCAILSSCTFLVHASPSRPSHPKDTTASTLPSDSLKEDVDTLSSSPEEHLGTPKLSFLQTNIQWIALSSLVFSVLALGMAGWSLSRDAKNRALPLMRPAPPGMPSEGRIKRQVSLSDQAVKLQISQQEQLQHLTEQIGQLRNEVGKIQEAQELAATPSPSLPTVTVPEIPAEITDKRPVIARIGEAFVAWCEKGGPQISRFFLFKQALEKALPGTDVQLLHRDANQTTVRFVTSSATMRNPIAYWLVTDSKQAWLIPEPMSSGQFREVHAECFVGPPVSPTSLHEFNPALLQREGEGWAVATKGKVG